MRTPTTCLLVAALALPAIGFADHFPNIGFADHLPNIGFADHLPNIGFADHLPNIGFADHLPVDHVRLAEPAGTGRLVVPHGTGAPVPLVVLMPDAHGEEGRSEPYVAALAARGIATLVFGFDGDPDVPQPARDLATAPGVVAVVQAWAMGQAPMIAQGRIGVLGFGAGARGALAAPEAGPTVALYPGCAGLDLPEWRPVLLLHGDRAPDAAVCAAMAEPPVAAIIALRGAGHAWDSRPGPWGQGDLLPAPDGQGRLRAMPDGRVTAQAAMQVAGWFAMQFAPSQVPRR